MDTSTDRVSEESQAVLSSAMEGFSTDGQIALDTTDNVESVKIEESEEAIIARLTEELQNRTHLIKENDHVYIKLPSDVMKVVRMTPRTYGCLFGYDSRSCSDITGTSISASSASSGQMT